MKKLLFGLLLSLFLLISTQPFSASDWNNMICQGYTGDIKIIFNGKLVHTNIKPFILKDQGITMVPLRDISEILGFEVIWNEKSNSIYIYSKEVLENSPHEQQSILMKSLKTRIEDMKVIRNVGPFYQKTLDDYWIAGRKFSSGVAVDLSSKKKTAEVVLDLYQQFDTLSGYFGVDDATMNSSAGFVLIVLADDEEIFVSETVKPSGYPKYIAPGLIDLSLVNRLTFRISWIDMEIGDYEQITAVLAHMNFFQK
ncbi:MAG: copper amine oxidase N-terminal domain-containing protein [Bacillota bacterium]